VTGDAAIIHPAMLPPPVVRDLVEFVEFVADTVDELGQIPADLRLSPCMLSALLVLGRMKVVSALLQSDRVFAHMPPMARYVMPGREAIWPLHADTDYNSHIRGEFLTVWVPLVPIDDACGGLRINGKPVAPMAPGDAVIMGMDCLHESMANRSDRARLSCDFRFFGSNASSSKHYMDCETGRIVAPC
jgi:hypothetical protein